MNTNIKIHPMKWLEGVKVNHNENPVRTARVADGGANYNQSALDIACTRRGDLKKEGALTDVITLLLLAGVNHNESVLRTTCLEGTGLVNHNQNTLRTTCLEGTGLVNHNESVLKGKVYAGIQPNHNESVLKGPIHAGIGLPNHNQNMLKGNVHFGVNLNHNESTLGTACVEDSSVNHNNESALKGPLHAGIGLPNHNESPLKSNAQATSVITEAR